MANVGQDVEALRDMLDTTIFDRYYEIRQADIRKRRKKHRKRKKMCAKKSRLSRDQRDYFKQ